MHILGTKPSVRSYALLLLIGLFVGAMSALSLNVAHAQDGTPPALFVWPDMDTNTLLSILVTLAAAWLTLPTKTRS